MKLVCAPETYTFSNTSDALNVVLFGHPLQANHGSAGAAVHAEVHRAKLIAAPRAWDFLSLALSVISADLAGHRGASPDGWTREFHLVVAVGDPQFWNAQRHTLQQALQFLTTDLWTLEFVEGGFMPAPPRDAIQPDEDCVVLLSGGLDSLIGAIDIQAGSHRPFAVTQTVRGDAVNQTNFAAAIGKGLRHLQLNHNAHVPDPENPPTQRARSIIFLAYGLLAATTLKGYHNGATIPLNICENGFIAINPPMTTGRLGSLSTRTTHPVYLHHIQSVFDAAGLRVRIQNPYQFKTKGEMMKGCANQPLLAAHATSSTSCGRFKIYGYTHCGRCVPCQVRRASFLASGLKDKTQYVFGDLGKDDADHAGFDDVRSVAIAIQESKAAGFDAWSGTAISATLMGDLTGYRDVLSRGLAELEALHRRYKVK